MAVQSRADRRRSSCIVVAEGLEPRRLLSGVVEGPEFQISEYPFGSPKRTVATDAQGGFVVAGWGALPGGVGYDVYARRFDAAANPVSPVFRVNQNAAYDQSQAVLDVAADGTFVVAWMGFTYNKGGNQSGYIYARRFAADGSPLTGDLQVTSGGAWHWDTSPAVATDATGNFVVAWQADRGGVLAQRFTAAGSPVGKSFTVSSDAPGTAVVPTVDMDDDGDFAVAWEAILGGGDSDVYVRRYTRAGKAFSSARLNQGYAVGAQQQVRLEMTGAGRFVAVWNSADQDGDGWGAFGRRYDASGQPLGTEFRVATQTTGDQQATSLDVRDDGSFVVTYFQDDGTVAHNLVRFDAAGTPSLVGDPIADISTAAARPDEGVVAIVVKPADPSTTGMWGRLYLPDSPAPFSAVGVIEEGSGEDGNSPAAPLALGAAARPCATTGRAGDGPGCRSSRAGSHPLRRPALAERPVGRRRAVDQPAIASMPKNSFWNPYARSPSAA